MLISPKPNHTEAYRLLHEGTQALSRAQQQGMRIHSGYITKVEKDLTNQIINLEKELRTTDFFDTWRASVKGQVNINSNTQLSYLLYKVMKLDPPKKTKTDKGSTDDEALTSLNLPELDLILRIRKLKKIRDTYLKAFVREQVYGYIHPNFNLHTVRTFRSSSDSPNFQNIPKRDKETKNIIRQAMFPRPGNQLMAADFKGVEVRIAACYHQDPTMLKYIHDPKSDLHRDLTKQIYVINKFIKEDSVHDKLRSATKNGFTFPQFYGSYYANCAHDLSVSWCEIPKKGSYKSGKGILLSNESPLSLHLYDNGIKNYKQFENHIKEIEYDFWYNRFPVYRKWKEKWWHNYQKNGYMVMATGFVCRGIMGKTDCINYPVQGAAFHCLLKSLILLDQYIVSNHLESKIIGQIHDEIVLDIYPPERDTIITQLNQIMTKTLPEIWKWIIVPLGIDIELAGIDEPWSSMKPL